MSDMFKLPRPPVITGASSTQSPVRPQKPQGTGGSFQEIFGKEIAKVQERPLTFSKHAQLRAQQRDIALSDADYQRLEQAVEKAGDKGITDTLVFMNNTAFIVNIPSRVVVTMVDGQDTEQTVFTNINGAVIV